MMRPRISLIITTYNWKEALGLCLQSALRQSLAPAEIVVADDGSGPDTAALLATVQKKAPLPIFHSWQQDKGFRLAKSRNKAIAQASGDYIVLVDGDMLLHPHFIADHAAHARVNFFVQGGRVLLGPRLTARLMAGEELRRPLFARDLENRKNCLRSTLLSTLFSRQSRGIWGGKYCNVAFWRQDALLVNGFNEAFTGWGREDTEFNARLLHAGKKRFNLRFYALGYHLHHPENNRNRLTDNDALLEKTISEQRCRCETGIDQYLRK